MLIKQLCSHNLATGKEYALHMEISILVTLMGMFLIEIKKLECQRSFTSHNISAIMNALVIFPCTVDSSFHYQP